MAAGAKLINAPKLVHVSVDGNRIDAREGEPLLQAMLNAGLDIPHYCYHPKLTIDGSCRRCVRFSREISKTAELHVFRLGDRSVLDIYDRRLDNDYSMCTADICPVGALETKDFHHKVRVWFLEETASVCPSCSNGCNVMLCTYKNRIWRLIPRRNDAVNDPWMCD